jgi:hypothetical protein
LISAFKKNDHLVSDYLNYREKHFNVIKKTIYTINYFKIIITASLLSIMFFSCYTTNEYWQFVAAEIIILLVINLLKIILGLETFYDVPNCREKLDK